MGQDGTSIGLVVAVVDLNLISSKIDSTTVECRGSLRDRQHVQGRNRGAQGFEKRLVRGFFLDSPEDSENRAAVGPTA